MQPHSAHQDWRIACRTRSHGPTDQQRVQISRGSTLPAREDPGQKEKRAAEDEMLGWHHRLDGHELGRTLGDGDGQGGLACCGPWGRKESDTTEQLNWTNHRTTECFLSSTSYHITKGLFLEFFYPVQHAQVSKINKEKMYSKSKKQKIIVRRERATKHQNQTRI